MNEVAIALIARVAQSAFRKNRQIGGGCVGAITRPCNVASTTDGGNPALTAERLKVGGKIAATKLRHLNAHVTVPLPSSDGGQHGMSAWSAIDISMGFVGILAPPVAGTMATEMAIREAQTVRVKAIMDELSGDIRVGVNSNRLSVT